MPDAQPPVPGDTAVRVASWRALHVEVDAPPHVFDDVVGAKLVAPDDGWRSRPDMSPFTRPFRASIVARAERAAAGARANVTPFVGFFTPTEMLSLARTAGFRDVRHVSAATLVHLLLCGQDRRLTAASQCRGTLGGHDLTMMVPNGCE